MGNLGLFNKTLQSNAPKFQSEGTYTLIIRLHHNVIKTGVRMISLSYSRISLADVARKLQLDSPEDAEFIVAKVCHSWLLDILKMQATVLRPQRPKLIDVSNLTPPLLKLRPCMSKIDPAPYWNSNVVYVWNVLHRLKVEVLKFSVSTYRL